MSLIQLISNFEQFKHILDLKGFASIKPYQLVLLISNLKLEYLEIAAMLKTFKDPSDFPYVYLELSQSC